VGVKGLFWERGGGKQTLVVPTHLLLAASRTAVRPGHRHAGVRGRALAAATSGARARSRARARRRDTREPFRQGGLGHVAVNLRQVGPAIVVCGGARPSSSPSCSASADRAAGRAVGQAQRERGGVGWPLFFHRGGLDPGRGVARRPGATTFEEPSAPFTPSFCCPAADTPATTRGSSWKLSRAGRAFEYCSCSAGGDQ
jgi:hypothetical protein